MHPQRGQACRVVTRELDRLAVYPVVKYSGQVLVDATPSQNGPLAAEMFARSVSVRDIEYAFLNDDNSPLLSRTLTCDRWLRRADPPGLAAWGVAEPCRGHDESVAPCGETASRHRLLQSFLAAGRKACRFPPMDATPHVLVVDDRREIREPLARYLERHELRATVAESATAARRILRAAAVDLVVLDIMMPGEDGLSFCRHLRETTRIPVILLTAMGEETDRIVGLEVGADDYVAKPFNPRELLARIKAVIRRTQSLPPDRDPVPAGTFRFDRWSLDKGKRELVDDAGVVTPLSTGEFRLLAALLERPGMVLSRDQLLDLTRGRGAVPFDRAIDNQVSRLRRKIERDPKNPALVVTVWGGGYRFAGTVERG